ncbi:hypothetical protein LCGC14_0510780 [marine sediment metagenome]|uniref:Uncharacterized protein n=1 Tax=marine sediment metagenome TaxID=412755 RepID=A0A0F9UMU5_9ZZZZ
MGIFGEILAKLRRILRRSVRLIVIAGDAVCGLFGRREIVEEEIVVERDPGGETAVRDTSSRSGRRPLTERVRQAASFRESRLEWRSMLMAHEHMIAHWIAGLSADDLHRVARTDADMLSAHLAGYVVDDLPPLPEDSPIMDVPAPLEPSMDPPTGRARGSVDEDYLRAIFAEAWPRRSGRRVAST